MKQHITSQLRRIIFLTIAILDILSSVARVRPAYAQSTAANFDAVDEYITTKMKELGVPGAALVIVEGDQIVHLKAFGVADASGRPVTPQTPFFTGSTGKSFTALAIMQLVEAGKIKLDEPVQTYLPWFRVADADASKTITVRQLLNMTSGIPQSIGQEQISNFDLSDSAIENNVRALAKVDLSAAPGERYEYSNANYVTLGMIIQAVSGESYEDYIALHIFKPLDMQNSFTSKSEAQKNGLVVGYQNWFGIPVALPNLPFSRGSLPAGQLNMSMEDFGHYLIAQLNDGSYQGASVLSSTGIATLHHPAVPMSDSTHFYGMGWEVQHFQDLEVIRHNGQVPGYTTDMFLVPHKHIAIAMSMNTYSPMLGVRVARLPSSVLRMLLDQEVIPGYEFPHMRIIYALVMLMPVLHMIAVVTTFRRFRLWCRSAQLPTSMQIARHIALPLIWNAAVAYVMLVALPIAFDANISTVILFQPDVGWMAVISGVFAIVWGVSRTSIVSLTLIPRIRRTKESLAIER
ncbi:MAG TPA: serine hydrolase domain-containing protein [Anaerolineales bacterium]|nr:serine hydrolase domain-containing protein [Anaerolineales bacterium]